MYATQDATLVNPTALEAVADSRSSTVPKGGPPTPEQRLDRFHELQSQALRHPDPLLASLGIMTGDLMQFAFRIQEWMTEVGKGDNLVEREQFLSQADTYLKFVRQVDRLAQIGRQQLQAAKPASEPN
jgi:hypothetical protein